MKKLSFKAEEIDTRLYNVEILEKLTAALQLSIDQASKNAATAQNTAKTAEATAKTAEAAAKTAQATANVATNTANVATSTANAASSAAATAKSLAAEGKLLAEQGKVLAEEGKALASTAQEAANTAQSTANAAQNTANTASSTAAAAKEAAATAKDVADQSKILADEAKVLADGLRATAEGASATAGAALSTAEAAQEAANAAQGAAEAAQATADAAASAAALTEVQAQVTELSAQVSTNTADVAQHTSDVAKLTADIAANTAGVAKATADVASLGADVTELQAQMTGEVKEFMDEVTLILEGDGVDTSGLQDNLDRIEEIATKADEKAVEARGKADTAQTDATKGINDAAAAQKSADDAQASATAANNAATTAQTKAEEAWTHADNARQAAERAQTGADEAATAAGVAQSKADEAFGHAQDALTAAENASKAADAAEELATKAEAKAVEAEGHANNAAAEATKAQEEATKAQSEAANAAISATNAAGEATKAQEFAASAELLAGQAEAKAQEADGHANDALAEATKAQGEAAKAQTEAQNAQNFATEAQDAAKEARAAADLAQLTADNKSSTFKGATDPVDAYNNAVIAYLANKTSVNLESIPAYPKVGDLWYEPTGEDTPDKVWQLSTAYLDIAEEVKDDNENIINVLYLIYKDEAFAELGGIWTDVMVNTITTGFVNALGITAQKMEVKDSSNNLLFKADASDEATNRVIIGGFGVKNNAIHSGMIDSMNAILTDGATGVYLGTDGLRVGNKFKVTPDGTVYSSEFKLSQEEIDKLALKVQSILYAKNDSGTVPPEEGWAETLPNAEAGEYVWTKYVYQDTDTDDSNNQYSYQVYRQPENGAPGKDGQDGANGKDGQDGADGLTPYIKDGYWWLGDTNTGVMAEPISYSISKNMEFHNGSEQTENLQFIAQKQIGQNKPEPNTDVIFRYKFADESSYTGPLEVNLDGTFVLSSSLFLNKNRQDLTVSIGHLDNGNFVEDDVEIINYISKSGYAVVLDNDVASLVYNSDGTEKLDSAQSVTATASLYENNKLVSYSTSMHLYYEWTLDGLTGNISSTKLTGNNDTITITAIDTDRDFGTATCIAIWEGSPQPHKAVTFKVSKNRQGIQGIQGETGGKGDKGDKGEKGDKGNTGDQGYGIVASVSRPSFTESQWETYGEIGRTETWSDTSSIRNGCRIGDIFTVNGTATDTKNAHVLYFKSTTNSGELVGTCLSHSIAERGATGSSGNTVVTTAYYYKTSASNYSTKPTSTTISNGTWTTNQLTPDKDNPYVYTSSVTKTNNNFTSATNPVKHSTLDGLVSLLSHGDVNLVTATKGSDNKYTYTLNADKLQGAMSDEVTVGGFTINSSSIYKDKSSLDTSGSGIYIGTDGIKVGDGFKVTKDGTVTIGYVDTALSTINGNISTLTTNVGTATSNAASALSAATTAASDASTAKSDAATAATNASSAKTIAGEAKTTADGAKSVADSASSVATTASNNASSALTQAGEAKTTAEGAKSEADKANEAVLKINGDIEAINANFEKITTGEIAAGKIEVKNGTSTVLYADAQNPEYTKVGGFTVTDNALFSGEPGSINVVYLGTDGLVVGDAFSVTSDGKMKIKTVYGSLTYLDEIVPFFGNWIQGVQYAIAQFTGKTMYEVDNPVNTDWSDIYLPDLVNRIAALEEKVSDLEDAIESTGGGTDSEG